MRKIIGLTLFAVTLISASLSAWSLPCGCQTFEGYYVGAAIGPAVNMASEEVIASANIQTTFGNDTTRDFSMVDAYQIRPWGEIFGGYGMRFCNWLYLGGRFGINFSSFDVGTPSAGRHEDIFDDAFISVLRNQPRTKLWNVEYTLDFKPGIVWCDQTMIFGIIGAAFNRATLEGNAVAVYIPTNGAPQPPASTLNVRGRSTSAGLRGGFGIEQMLTYCMSIHLTYVYTSYWGLEARGAGDMQSLAVIPNGHTARFRSHARKQVTTVGLSYYF